ncbi:MAG: condensation domain-containing protein, partial [Psychrosphaera sp.]|nr:condensation domain-containing protein [Psychrosphaera sp.]
YEQGNPNSSPLLYKTGDLVRYLPGTNALPDGNVAFVGRVDDLVKIRGFRIELGENETQLSALDIVDAALVLAKELAGSLQLVGYVIPPGGLVDNAEALVSDVLEALEARLPQHMVPSFIMVLEQWPLTPNGKIDRKALPTPDGNVLQGKYVEPNSEIEHALVDIWASLLKCEAQSISITADFFESGGHSLLCIRLVSEIRSRLDVEISIQSIFDHSTLQALAVVVEQSTQAAARPPLLAVKRDSDKLAVSFAQQRLWFIDSLQGGSAEYNLPTAYEVEGQFDITLLSAVFKTIVERHEILRTVYFDDNGQTLQHIRNMADIDFEISIEDLSDLSADGLETQVECLVQRDITTAFDLTSDLMLRVCYIKKTSTRGVLLFNMHHIASDGWSMEVLSKEFFALYQAYSQGLANPLEALAIQYADFALWQKAYLEGQVLDSQLDYWAQQLDELPAVHSLPLDFPRPDIKKHEGALVTSELCGAVAKQLLAVAKQYKLTPFMLLHGALSLLLSRHSNAEDIVIGTPVANRLQRELEPLIGFFVNTLVLRADTNFTTLADYFVHIRQVHLDAQSHQ